MPGEAEAVSDAGDGSIRDPDLNVESKEQRDNLQRRVDMERSSINHALGQTEAEARSFRYDDQDYLTAYLPGMVPWFEEPLVKQKRTRRETAGNSDAFAECHSRLSVHGAKTIRANSPSRTRTGAPGKTATSLI